MGCFGRFSIHQCLSCLIHCSNVSALSSSVSSSSEEELEVNSHLLFGWFLLHVCPDSCEVVCIANLLEFVSSSPGEKLLGSGSDPNFLPESEAVICHFADEALGFSQLPLLSGVLFQYSWNMHLMQYQMSN